MTEKFTLRGDYIELCKLLKLLGWCESGGAAKHAVGEGLVTVNAAVETRKACKIRKGQSVEYAGKIVIVE